MTAIQERLFAQQDAEYAAFQRPLMPTVGEEAFIGVRTPALRSLAKELRGQLGHLRPADAEGIPKKPGGAGREGQRMDHIRA